MDNAQGAYLFATNNMLLAACYAVPNGLKHFCAPTETGGMILVIQKKALATERALDATVFVLPDEHFREVPTIEEQFVTETSIHKDDLNEHMKVGSLDDMMELGVQIFVPGDNVDEFSAIDVRDLGDPESYVARLLLEGKLRWLNGERGIRPIAPSAGRRPAAGGTAPSAPKP